MTINANALKGPLVEKLATEVSNAYDPQQVGLVCDSGLPILTRKEDIGILSGYGLGQAFITDTKASGEGGYRKYRPIIRETDNRYQITPHKLQGRVSEEDYLNVEEPFEAQYDEIWGLTSSLYVEKEDIFANLMFNSAVVTNGETPTNKFDSYSNSSPLEVFQNARRAVYRNCGFQPNRALLSREVEITLQYHPNILSTLGFDHTRAGTLTEEELKKVLKVEHLHIGSVRKASSFDSDTLDSVWDDNILFYHAPNTPAKRQVSFGYHLKSKVADSVQVIEDNDNPDNDKIFVKKRYGYIITNANAGYLVSDVLS